jgi:hypothetical protein
MDSLTNSRAFWSIRTVTKRKKPKIKIDLEALTEAISRPKSEPILPGHSIATHENGVLRVSEWATSR